MKLYPVMLDLRDKPVTVIGGGGVAERKIRGLAETGALVRVIAPGVSGVIKKLAAEFPGRIAIDEREYRPGDLDGAFIVFSASDDPEVSRRVHLEADGKNILINSGDDPGKCTFHVPSYFRKGGLLVAVSTGGASPAMSARLRRELEAHIPDDIGPVLEGLGRIRELLKSDTDFSGLTSSARGTLLKKISESDYLLRRTFEAGMVDALLRKIIADALKSVS